MRLCSHYLQWQQCTYQHRVVLFILCFTGHRSGSQEGCLHLAFVKQRRISGEGIWQANEKRSGLSNQKTQERGSPSQICPQLHLPAPSHLQCLPLVLHTGSNLAVELQEMAWHNLTHAGGRGYILVNASEAAEHLCSILGPN